MKKIEEGEQAPEVSGKDQNGNEISLSKYRGKKVILYFYPKDDTPGCTTQACNLRDHHDDLIAKGLTVIGVSADTEKKHQNFIEKYELPFPLIADTDKEIINAFGVWGEKKFMGRIFDGIHRMSFLVDDAGKIEKAYHKVKAKEHPAEVLAEL